MAPGHFRAYEFCNVGSSQEGGKGTEVVYLRSKPCPVFAGIPAKSNPSLSCHLGPVRSVQQVDPARGILISDWVFWITYTTGP